MSAGNFQGKKKQYLIHIGNIDVFVIPVLTGSPCLTGQGEVNIRSWFYIYLEFNLDPGPDLCHIGCPATASCKIGGIGIVAHIIRFKHVIGGNERCTE